MFIKVTDSLELVPNSSFVIHCTNGSDNNHYACEYALMFSGYGGRANQVSRIISNYSVSTNSSNWHLGHNTIDQHYALMDIINTGFAGEFQVGCYI
jgi:hypothetical protein